MKTVDSKEKFNAAIEDTSGDLRNIAGHIIERS